MLGLTLGCVELLRLGFFAERHVEWWASSWSLGIVGALSLTAIVMLARIPRLTALEAAAAVFAVNAPLVAAFAIVELSTDWMCGTTEQPTVWVGISGCTGVTGVNTPVGGRVTGAELAFGLSMVAAVGFLPAQSHARAVFHALLSALVIGCAAACVGWGTSAAYVGLAFALVVWAMSARASHWRAMLARVFAALAFALLILWDALVEILTIRGGGQIGPSGDRTAVVHAAERFARIENPLPYLVGAAAVLLVLALGPLVRRPRAAPASGPSATWLAVGVAAVLIGCVAHFGSEKDTFHAQLRHALQHDIARRWPEYLPAIKGHDEARVSSLLLVPHLEEPASVIAMGPHGRVEQHPSGDRVRVVVSEDNTAESIARALFKRRSENGAFELVLARAGQ